MLNNALHERCSLVIRFSNVFVSRHSNLIVGVKHHKRKIDKTRNERNPIAPMDVFLNVDAVNFRI